MTLYKNKYRVESIRLSNRDYRANGYYFVTICIHEKSCYFGDIIKNKMQFSQVGKVAKKNWQIIPEHFHNIYLDAYVIMPNHLHGIIVIDRPDNKSNTPNQFAPLKPGSLSAIIQAYKASVTRWCRKNDDDIFRWQSRFYEHIIRDQRGLENIRNYIVNNPVKWSEDKHNPVNLKLN